MSNDRNVSAIEGFDEENYYEAPDAGTFNEKSADSEFAAFCLFYVTGGYQRLNGSSGAMWLWGNYDADNDTGWGLAILNNNTLVALLGDGAATTTLSYALSGSASIERLIMAQLWQSGDFCALAINGSIAAQDDIVTVAPSVLPARVGFDPNDVGMEASYVGISAVGYNPTAPDLGARGIGLYAGNSFRAAREDLRGSLRVKPSDIDWLHRYEAATFGQGVAGTLEKNATGQARLTVNARPDGNWLDVGNRGFTTDVAAAVPLTRVAP